MSVTVCMITKDSDGPYLRAALASTKREFPGAPFILADSGTDATPETVRSFYPDALVVRDAGNRAQARQRCIENVRTEWLFFQDDDIELQAGWMTPWTFWLMGTPAVGQIWGPFTKLDSKAHYERQFKSYRLRGGTHDLLVRMEALGGIRIPSSLQCFEDAYIRNYVESRGYVCAINPKGCRHLKSELEEQHEKMGVSVPMFQRCGAATGYYRTRPFKSFRTLAMLPVKAPAHRRHMRRYAGQRLRWAMYYAGYRFDQRYRSDPPNVRELVKSQRGALAFDVGANAGAVSRVLSRRFAKVVAVEPAEESFAILKRYAPRNVRSIQSAVSEYPALTLREQPNGQLSSLTWERSLGTRTVPSASLWSLMDRFGAPDFLKVDVEGFEVSVLKSAGDRLRYVRSIIVEIHSKEGGDECAELLSKAGKAPRAVRHPAYAPGEPLFYRHYWLRA
jgi:FkbM family methyltransferase